MIDDNSGSGGENQSGYQWSQENPDNNAPDDTAVNKLLELYDKQERKYFRRAVITLIVLGLLSVLTVILALLQLYTGFIDSLFTA